MKVAFIIHNVSETESIDQILEKLEIKNFTRIDKAVGKVANTDPLYDNKIWPGYFTITIVEDTENKIEEIRKEVKYLKEHLKIPEIKYYELEAANFF
ncbi:MAG: PG0541 family transporter-associated protein [Ignavibacteria bacterium]